jgi:hypothetical protein
MNSSVNQAASSPLSVTALLESIRKQATAYRNEDNGDESKWSLYNQGRADALLRLEGDIRRMLSNTQLSDAQRSG